MQIDDFKLQLFIKQRFFILFRGLITLGASLLIAVFALISPNVSILSSESSWLPLIALMILLYGLLEFFDALITRKSAQYLIYVQMAVLDSVVGLIVLVEHYNEQGKLVLLLAAYLIIKGLFRVIAATNVNFPRSTRVILGSLVSLFLGMTLWIEGDTLSTQMITLALCMDFALRGWSLIVFSRWLIRSAKQDAVQS